MNRNSSKTRQKYFETRKKWSAASSETDLAIARRLDKQIRIHMKEIAAISGGGNANLNRFNPLQLSPWIKAKSKVEEDDLINAVDSVYLVPIDEDESGRFYLYKLVKSEEARQLACFLTLR